MLRAIVSVLVFVCLVTPVHALSGAPLPFCLRVMRCVCRQEAPTCPRLKRQRAVRRSALICARLVRAAPISSVAFGGWLDRCQRGLPQLSDDRRCVGLTRVGC